MSSLSFNSLHDQAREEMIRKVSDEEIKGVFMEMNPNKSPNPDGWNECFYKDL